MLIMVPQRGAPCAADEVLLCKSRGAPIAAPYSDACCLLHVLLAGAHVLVLMVAVAVRPGPGGGWSLSLPLPLPLPLPVPSSRNVSTKCGSCCCGRGHRGGWWP